MSNLQMVVVGYAIIAVGVVAIAVVDGAFYAWLTRQRRSSVNREGR